MRETIVFWDSDPALRTAISAALQGRGYNPVALHCPEALEHTLRLLEPSLLILEGGWDKGAGFRISADTLDGAPGDLAVILPCLNGTGVTGSPAEGVVIERLRKPFGSSQLMESLGTARMLRERLARWKSDDFSERIEVRRLRDEGELEDALRLRRDVYLETGYLPEDCPPLECDNFDSRSIILGAFVHSGGGRELAGTLRMIRTSVEGPHSHELRKIAIRHEMNHCLSGSLDEPLPACESFRVEPPDLVRAQEGFGGALSSSGAKVSTEVCELSRLAVPAAWRRHRLGIERKLFELVVVDSVASSPRRNWFVIAVHPGKRIKFHRYGFQAVNELGVQSYAGLDQPAILMTLDLQRYLLSPNPFATDLDQEILLYRVTGGQTHTLEERSLAAAG